MRRRALSSAQTPALRTRQTMNLQAISMDCPLPLTGVLTLRDVKNEDRPGYVYEYTGNTDKLSTQKTGFLQKNAPIVRSSTEIGRVYGRKLPRLYDIARRETASAAPAPDFVGGSW
jgi:hypothetical protein